MIKGAIGVALVALSLGPGSPASAATFRYHRSQRRSFYRRDLGGYRAQAYDPLYSGPAMGTWRYKLLEPHCDDTYPMMESSCGTATGGPVGGMGS